MKKVMKRVAICFLMAAFAWCGTVVADRQRLDREIVRLHVVANSDSKEDQWRKILVRDAVVSYLEEGLHDIADVDAAKAYIQEKLPQLKSVAEQTLAAAGWEGTVEVSLNREAFAKRDYDTFSLPAGIYDALKIMIGEGTGENWWCVVFPELCVPATTEEFAAVAAGSGFSQPLAGALRREKGYSVRFFLLDALGRLEICWLEP